MASSYEEALYYSEEIITKGVSVPSTWVTVYDCTPQLWNSVCHHSSLPNERPFL